MGDYARKSEIKGVERYTAQTVLSGSFSVFLSEQSIT